MKKLSALAAMLCIAFLAFAGNAPKKAPAFQRPVELSVNRLEAPILGHFAALQRVAAQTMRDFTAIGVQAAYYGSYTGDASDWALFFLDTESSFCIYADIYGSADATHIDGTYTLSDGSIGEALVVRAAGDTATITSGTITVLHNTSTNYRFTVNLSDGSETYTLSQDLDVYAYDYLYYVYSSYGYDMDYDIALEDADEQGGGDITIDDPDYSYEPTEVTTVNKTMNAAYFDTSYFTEDGDVDIYLYDVNAQGDTTEIAAFYVYVPQVDPDTYVPVGTYTFALEPTTGQVQASQGLVLYNYQYYPTAAYYVFLDSEGYIESLYYLVAGTLTVSKDANDDVVVTVHATSGNGSTINITYGGAAESAVENLNAASVQKILRDGQLIIRKDGREFNALGAEL